MKFHDFSIPENNPIHNAQNAQALENAILTEIRKCNVLVCPTGMYATHSKWIANELRGAGRVGRKILGVNPWAQERKSSVVASAADKLVGWTQSSVGKGVWELYADLANGR